MDVVDVVLWILIGLVVLWVLRGHDTPGEMCGPGPMGGTECEWTEP